MTDGDTGRSSLDAIMRAAGPTKATPADAPEIELDVAFWRNARIVSTETRRKTSVHLRLDPETLALFRAAGKGHPTPMAKVLKAYARSHGKPSEPVESRPIGPSRARVGRRPPLRPGSRPVNGPFNASVPSMPSRSSPAARRRSTAHPARASGSPHAAATRCTSPSMITGSRSGSARRAACSAMIAARRAAIGGGTGSSGSFRGG